jgi:hypothetical protein
MGEVLNRVEVVVFESDHPKVELHDGDIAIRPEGSSDATIWLPQAMAERWMGELLEAITRAGTTGLRALS